MKFNLNFAGENVCIDMLEERVIWKKMLQCKQMGVDRINLLVTAWRQDSKPFIYYGYVQIIFQDDNTCRVEFFSQLRNTTGITKSIVADFGDVPGVIVHKYLYIIHCSVFSSIRERIVGVVIKYGIPTVYVRVYDNFFSTLFKKGRDFTKEFSRNPLKIVGELDYYTRLTPMSNNIPTNNIKLFYRTLTRIDLLKELFPLMKAHYEREVVEDYLTHRLDEREK